MKQVAVLLGPSPPGSNKLELLSIESFLVPKKLGSVNHCEVSGGRGYPKSVDNHVT